MLPPEGTSAPFCNSPITVSDVTDLPEPLSPTTHSVSPSCTCSETPSMMRSAAGFLAEADDEVVDVEDDVGHVSSLTVVASECGMQHAVIPGWCAAPDPESRDSGFALRTAPE